MSDHETVGDGWSDERIQGDVSRVAHGVPPNMRNQAVTVYQAEQLMFRIRADLRTTIATQAARIDELEAQVEQAISVYKEVMGVVLPEHKADKARIEQQDSDWLAMTKAIVAVTDIVDPTNEWAEADDATLLEQFDPWQSLRELERLLASFEKLACSRCNGWGKTYSGHVNSQGEKEFDECERCNGTGELLVAKGDSNE